MATWKKLVVSGSAISQLVNNSGYISASQVPAGYNAFSTASYNGTPLIAAASGTLTFASSSGQGLTIAANAGTDTLTFGLASIPNASLANSSIAIGTTVIALGATGSTLAGLTSVTATNFTGTASFATNADLLDGLHATAFVLNSQTSSMTVTSASYAINASSSLQAVNADTVDGLHAVAFVLNSQTSSMTVNSASYAINSNTASFALQAFNATSASHADLLDGLHATAFVLNSQTSSMTVNSASFAINASSSLYAVSASHADLLDGLHATAFVLNSQTSSMAVSSSLSAISASFAVNASSSLYAVNTANALTASNITPAISNTANNRVLTDNGGGTINGEANLTFDGSTLILNGSQTISGDLTVNGTTTTINTANLNVSDKFILLSSGSTSANDGGIIIQSATGGTGFAFLYDSAQARWAFTGSLSGLATTAAPDAFVATVLDLNVAESTDKAIYQKAGNIKIATNEDIFIWS